MGDRLRDFWADLLGLVPEILLFLLILIVGLVLAKVLAKGTDALLNRLRVNRLFSRNVEQATSRRVAWNVVGVLSKVVFWLIVLFTLYFAFGVFGETNPFYRAVDSILGFIFPGLLVALAILVFFIAAAGVVRGLVSAVLEGLSYGRTLANIAGGFILAIGVITALAQVGIAVAVTLPVLYAFLLTMVVGVGGALAVVLRAPLARILDNVTDRVDEVATVVSTETDNPDNVVAGPTAPVVTSPPRLTRRNRENDL